MTDFFWIQKYLKNKYQSTNIVTLPHFGSLWRSLAAHELTMMLKIILCQGFGKSISIFFLFVNGDGEYFDKPLLHIFSNMMVPYLDVLGPRAKLGKPCKFEGAWVAFKNFAIQVGLSTKNREILLPHFLQGMVHANVRQ